MVRSFEVVEVMIATSDEWSFLTSKVYLTSLII